MKENLLPYYPSYYINEDGTEVYRKNSFISSKGKIYQKNKGSDWYKLRIKICSDGRPKVNLWKDNHRVKVRIQRIRDGRFHFNSGWNAFSDRKKYRIYRFMLRHPDYTANEIAKKFSTGRCMVFKIKKKYGS